MNLRFSHGICNIIGIGEPEGVKLSVSFTDIFKQSFLEGYGNIDLKAILVTLAVSCLFALYIFLVYRVLTRKTFYSKAFNISLAGVTVITSAIILTIQSSVVVSLGMVGALSIVRFRTAIKEPMDLMFLFWSISAGIIVGAGVAGIAVILSIVLTLGMLILDRFPVARALMLLVINASNLDAEAEIMKLTKRYARHAQVKSRNITAAALDMIVELRTDSGAQLVRELMNIDGIHSVSLMAHDGEATF